MTNPANVDVSCRLIGDFVDVGELPPDVIFARGEVVNPSSLIEMNDLPAIPIQQMPVIHSSGERSASKGGRHD
jgi:hypothetical protein